MRLLISMLARNATCVRLKNLWSDIADSAWENIALFFALIPPLARSGQSFLDEENRSISPLRIRSVERRTIN